MPEDPASTSAPYTAELLRCLGIVFGKQPVELHARLAATLTSRAREAHLGRVYVALSAVAAVLVDKIEDIGPETLLELDPAKPAAPPKLFEPGAVLGVLEKLDGEAQIETRRRGTVDLLKEDPADLEQLQEAAP